jgi:hypothetical protein
MHTQQNWLLDCTVTDTLHVSSCTHSIINCTGLYSIWHTSCIILHTQQNWLCRTAQYLAHYMFYHAHPAELAVLDCTTSGTLHVLHAHPAELTVLDCTASGTLHVSSCTLSLSICINPCKQDSVKLAFTNWKYECISRLRSFLAYLFSEPLVHSRMLTADENRSTSVVMVIVRKINCFKIFRLA